MPLYPWPDLAIFINVAMLKFGYERGLAYRIIVLCISCIVFNACKNIIIAKLGGAWEQDYRPYNYTRLIALNQSLHGLLTTGVLLIFCFISVLNRTG